MIVAKGRGVRVELGASLGTQRIVTGVSAALNAVVSSAAHGFSEYTVGFFSGMSGMVQLEGQAAQVMGPLANIFLARALNTANFSEFSAGYFTPVASWVLLAEATSYQISVGASAIIDRTTILDVIQRQARGLLGAQVLSLNTIAATQPTPALLLTEQSAQLGLSLIVRITHPDGSVRIARGIPSFAGEDVQQGAVGTGSISFFIDGFVLKLPGTPVTAFGVQNYVATDYMSSDYVGGTGYVL